MIRTIKYSVKIESSFLPSAQDIVFEVCGKVGDTYTMYAHSNSAVALMNYIEDNVCSISSKGLQAYQEACSEIVERPPTNIHLSSKRMCLKHYMDSLLESGKRILYSADSIWPLYSLSYE